MGRVALLVLVFGLAFLSALVVLAPARLVFDALARSAAVETGLVHGSVWDARAWRVRVGDLELGAVTARLQPASLVGGAARFETAVAGPALRANGVLAASPGGLALEDVRGVAQLALWPAARGWPLPQDAPVQLAIEEVRFGPDGACQTAAGRLTTAALADFGARQQVDLPVLTGDLFCAGAALGLSISGAGETLSLDGRATVTGPDPQWRIEARTRDTEVMTVLAVLGFDQQGDVFVADSAVLAGR